MNQNRSYDASVDNLGDWSKLPRDRKKNKRIDVIINVKEKKFLKEKAMRWGKARILIIH